MTGTPKSLKAAIEYGLSQAIIRGEPAKSSTLIEEQVMDFIAQRVQAVMTDCVQAQESALARLWFEVTGRKL